MAEQLNTAEVALAGIEFDPIFSETLRNNIVKTGKAATKLPLVFTTKKEVDTAEEIIKQAKKQVKQVADIRLSFSRPLDEKKAQLMQLEKQVVKPAADAEKALTDRVNAYHRKVAADAAAERLRIQQEGQKQLNRLRSPTSIAAAQQQTEAALETVAEQPAGTRRVMIYEVVDLNKVPREFLMIDPIKVKEAINKKNMTEIPGLLIKPDFVRSGR